MRSSYRLFQVRILVRIRRRAATEKPQRLRGFDRVPYAGRDEDRIAGADHSAFSVQFYLACAFEDEIKLFQNFVIMPLCPAACGDARFRETLFLHGRIRAIKNRTNRGAVFRDKRRLGREILNGHGSANVSFLPVGFERTAI